MAHRYLVQFGPKQTPHLFTDILVIGDKEMEANAVAVRLRTGEDLGAKPVPEFVALLEQVNRSRTLKLVP